MKTRVILLLISIASATLLFNCKKSNPASPSSQTSKTYFDFLKNTQWVGVLDGSGYQYAPPCCLRVNADTTLAVYAPFAFWINNAWEYVDSLKGKISNIDSLPDGRTKIKINFNYLGDVEIYITDRQTLTGYSQDANKQVPFEAEIFPKDVDVGGTTWSGPVMTDQSATGFAYPDVSSVSFSGNKLFTTYTRNGKIMADNSLKVIEISYTQKGAMVFFYGFNETNNIEPAYFGVLKPSGDAMMVYSGSSNARLPNYVQTTAWYGPIGVTPVINKQ